MWLPVGVVAYSWGLGPTLAVANCNESAQGWTVHAFTNDGRFYKLFMVDAHKDRVKILFHKM